MIRVQHLELRAGNFQLSDLNFEVPTGKYGVLMGRTGSGKTTILEAVCGLRAVASGTITLMDREVTRLPPASRGVGYVPQDRALFQTMSVRQNLGFALELRGWKRPEIKARVEELARWLGIEHLLQRKPEKLSGGEGQRVALGRALAAEPAVLCLDEPLSALDDTTREEISQLLKSIQAQTGVTVLHVTHHLGEAERLADTVLKLENGRIRMFPAGPGERSRD